eukprot:TRINITY_DN9183_c0_g1_i1.p1 TRINITY_DN9183_c0_g1~~TRINITY_DN9183_c0_g1_i1.p1  ORF type:complete len:382 (-),score=122.82 TRINITY_DN9183_c0_g1_i1:87-1121(-)
MSKLEVVPLGSQGLKVAAQGLGTMGMTAFYTDEKPIDAKEKEAESLRTISRYVELCGGKNAFLDTAWIYRSATEHNETLVGKAIAQHGRDKFIIATKFGQTGQPKPASPENIRQQLAESLARLGTDYVDLYYQHRQDPDTPIESVAETLKQLVAEGKIKYVGYSEVTASEIRRAHRIFPITAIQMEWSLQARGIEKAVVPTARELGIGIVPYSPLGRGMLAGRWKSTQDFADDDWRRTQPRYSGENMEKNRAAVERFEALAKKKRVTPAQLALAWVHAQGRDVVPIPGTKTVARLEENVAAASVRLSKEGCAGLEAAVPEAEGERYVANPAIGFLQTGQFEDRA